MMQLQQRRELLVRLGDYIKSDDAHWQEAKEKAARENPWFTPGFIELAAKNIADAFLDRNKLEDWTKQYQIPEEQKVPKKIGVVMAGNIPLVGFHDLLCVFISGHRIIIKPSSKDEVLIKYLVKKLTEWDASINDLICFADNLKNCDAYIATGSNNSGRYFEYYFAKYPHIIRRNRTSVAVLDGSETPAELSLLADDMQLYFGLGCRNVTKLYVPKGYDFIPLLNALKRYDHFLGLHKYKHNFDYQLALLMMRMKFYMNSGAVLLVEDAALFSAVSRVNYELYENKDEVVASLKNNEDVQCIVGAGFTAFGKAQQPSLTDHADGVDTLAFLLKL